MGFTNVPETLRTTSRSAHTALGELRGADCGKPVAGVAGALPGAKAGATATMYSDTWSQTFTEWCTGADAHGTAFATAADTYVAGDHAAAEAIPGSDAPGGPR